MEMLDIPIKEIKVAERVRKDLGDIAEMSDSISKLGLINPITVKRLDVGYSLVAGERRLEAYKKLGRNTISCVIVSSLDDLQGLKIEQDENRCRKDLTPSEAYKQGQRIEELEGPKARERQRDAGKAFGRGKKNSLGPVGSKLSNDTPNEQPEPSEEKTEEKLKAKKTKLGRTAEIVGRELGLSGRQYTRLKRIFKKAEEYPEDEVIQDVKNNVDKYGIHKADNLLDAQLIKIGDKPKPKEKKNTKRGGDNVGSRPRSKKSNDVARSCMDMMDNFSISISILELEKLGSSVRSEFSSHLREHRTSVTRLINKLEGVNNGSQNSKKEN